jgi:phosphatidylglycerol:prolipoprotein diacylglycerol transferase
LVILEEDLMHPILFQWGSWTVRSYHATMFLGFILFYLLSLYRVRTARLNVHIPRIFLWSLSIFLVGLVGARAAFVVSDWAYYAKHLHEIHRVDQGGLMIWGGIVALGVGGPLVARWLRLPLFVLADLGTLPALAAGVIGRMGCFLQGCCLGKMMEGDWGLLFGVMFPSEPIFRYPIQLYEMVVLSLLFILLVVLERRPHRPGAIFVTGVTLYADWRLVSDFLRNDHDSLLGPLSAMQILFLIVAGMGSVWAWYLWRSAPPKPSLKETP